MSPSAEYIQDYNRNPITYPLETLGGYGNSVLGILASIVYIPSHLVGAVIGSGHGGGGGGGIYG